MAAAFLVGGWIGEALVGNLVNIVSSFLVDQRDENIKTALMKLEANLLPIQLALREAENRELALEQPELGKWMWHLRDAVEEAEDVLDEMEYYRLERQIFERDAEEVPKPAATSGMFESMYHKVRASCSTSMHKFMKIGMEPAVEFGKRVLHMHPTLNKLNSVVENLKLVKENIDVLNSVVAKSPSLWGGNNSNNTNSRETGHVLTVDVEVGREEDKKEVLKWLTKSGGDSQESYNISALIIWGIAGVGKTTLAQSVYNDDSLKGYFQVKMWVCVSNNQLSMVEIMKKAVESATRNPPMENIITNLQEKLKKIVETKRCLIVLDDIWDGQRDQNKQQWENFIGVISKYAEGGSRMLITSRMKYQGLPDKVKSNFLSLSCLNEDKSLSLFYKHAFDGVDYDEYPNLKSVGKIIVKKCGGLPLALKIIGGLLNARLEISYWLSVAEKNLLKSEESMNYVNNVLKLSYHCLPSNLQSCFRICSLFPQDYEFKKDELVALWMSLGFIIQNRDENSQPEDIGQNYLDIFVRRSFFVYDCQRESYTMHDLLHDLAREVSTGESLRVEENISVPLPNTLRHLFIDKFNSKLLKEISSLKNLRTLALAYLHYDPAYFPTYGELSDILKKLTSLRALFVCLRTIPDLSIIGQLKHLRLFHLKVNILNKHLKPLYKLYQLQNLRCIEVVKSSKLKDAYHRIENEGIGNLVKLRFLDLPEIIFDEITEFKYLTDLQKLKLHLKKGSMLKLSDMKNLNKLRHLSIIDDREKTSCVEAQEAYLLDKTYLESLLISLEWANREPQLHKEVCNCLQPQKYSNIRDLEVTKYSGVVAPRWMTSDYLPCMTNLKLSECNNLRHLPPLGQLPSLKVLSLENITGLIQSGTEFYGSDDVGGFRSLLELQINEIGNWEEWTNANNTSWFTRLSKLSITNCQKLSALPTLPLSLKRLELMAVGLIAPPVWQDVYENELSPSIEYLKIDNCEKLVYFQPFLSICSSLEQLWINQCLDNSNLSLDSSSFGLLDGLSSLTRLRINFWGLASIRTFDWAKISSLQALRIERCGNISSLDGLHALTGLAYLSITKCDNLLESLSSSTAFDQTKPVFSFHVKEVEIDNMLLLQIEPLWSMTTNYLQIIGDKYARSLPHQWLLRNHTSLIALEILDCSLLELLPNEMPSSLSSLWIENCPLLKSLPNEIPSTLSDIFVYYCPLLKSLSGEMPSSLKRFSIFYCQLLESLHDRMPSMLTSSVIGDCPLLKSLPTEIPSLMTLSLYNSLLESLPQQLPSSLKIMDIFGCSLLKSLPDNMPSSLEWLVIKNCPLLKLLPNEMPSSLIGLKIINCPMFNSLPDKIPSSLRMLWIIGCPAMQSLPPNMPSSLMTLFIIGCPILKSLPDNMPCSLRSLWIIGCPVLKKWYQRIKYKMANIDTYIVDDIFHPGLFIDEAAYLGRKKDGEDIVDVGELKWWSMEKRREKDGEADNCRKDGDPDWHNLYILANVHTKNYY